jgi:predicted TIM-barrel fold metal-dependent hydrolase
VALLHEIAGRGRPLLIHVDGADWQNTLLEVARAHPRWKVIVAHAGPGTAVRASAELVERTQNVYMELSTSMPDLPVVREVVRRAGRERLLFGSDAPLLDAAYALGLYADAGADLEATTATAREVFGW